VPVEEKLLRQVRIGEEAAEAEEMLALLSKGSIAELEALWAEEFIDRQVRDELDRLFGPEPDEGLIRLLRRRLPKLTPGQIRAGLGRLRFDIGQGELQPIATTPLEPSGKPKREGKPKEKRPFGEATPWSSVTLGDLISEGLLKPPAELHRRYKGQELHAQIRPDGRVSFAGDVYGSLSIAGGEARRSVLGDRPGRPRRPQTNGWTFWRLRDQHGNLIEVDQLRRALWETKGSSAS
jgi:Restriction Enzyme Adenine Methylase Associated